MWCWISLLIYNDWYYLCICTHRLESEDDRMDRWGSGEWNLAGIEIWIGLILEMGIIWSFDYAIGDGEYYTGRRRVQGTWTTWSHSTGVIGYDSKYAFLNITRIEWMCSSIIDTYSYLGDRPWYWVLEIWMYSLWRISIEIWQNRGLEQGGILGFYLFV